MADGVLEDVKRVQEVADRPRPQATLPAELRSAPSQHEFSKASYSLAAPKKPKSDTEKSLEWNAQQRKVAESQ